MFPLTAKDLEEWVRNDEALYNTYQAYLREPGRPRGRRLTSFVRENRPALEAYVRGQRSHPPVR